MKGQNGPQWKALGLIVLAGGLALVEEARLPLPEAADGWALLVWVLFFYGALMLWVAANRRRLEEERHTRQPFTWHLRSEQARQEDSQGD